MLKAYMALFVFFYIQIALGMDHIPWFHLVPSSIGHFGITAENQTQRKNLENRKKNLFGETMWKKPENSGLASLKCWKKI